MQSQTHLNKYKVKLLVIGGTEVGKTQIINRLCDTNFQDNYEPTLGIDFKIKHIDKENKSFILYLWDTSGQEKFQSVTDYYIQGSKIVLFVFDLSQPNSFELVKLWIDKVNNMDPNIHKILIGNKCDKEQSIQNEKITTLNQTEEIQYFEISAKEDINIINLSEYINQLLQQDFPSNDEIQKLSSIILYQNLNNKARDNCCGQCSIM